MAKRGASASSASASATARVGATSDAAFEQRLRALPAELFGRVLDLLSYRECQLQGLGLASKALREATFGGMRRAVVFVRGGAGGTRVQDAVRLFPNVKELVLQVGSERERPRRKGNGKGKGKEGAEQKQGPLPCLWLPGLAGFKSLQKLVLVITGEFEMGQAGDAGSGDGTGSVASGVELPHLQTLEVVCPDRRTTGCSADACTTMLTQMRLPKLKELDLLGIQESTSMSIVSGFRGLEALGVRMDQEDFEALVGRMEDPNDATFKGLRRLTVVIRKLTEHRGLVERLARGGVASPLFKLKDIECQIASNHRAKHSPEAQQYWLVPDREMKDMTAEKWDVIIARRQAALLVEGFGPGDKRVTHALIDLLEESGRTLPTITILDGLETVLLEAPTPALAGVAARAELVAEQALAALRAAAADGKKGEPIPVLARLSSLCSLRRRGRRAWPVGESPFPSCLAFAALRSSALATLLSLLHHKDAEGRDVGARVLALLRALPLEAFVKELRTMEDPEEYARAMAGVTLPLLLRLTDVALLRHRAGDMRRLWNLGVLAQVLKMAERAHVRQVWQARRRGLVFAMLQCLSLGYSQEWNLCSQNGRLDHPVFALFSSLAVPIEGVYLRMRDMVLDGSLCAGEPGRDVSSQLMRNRAVLLARLVLFLFRRSSVDLGQGKVLPAGALEAWVAERQKPGPFSLAKMEIAVAVRHAWERGTGATKAMLRDVLPEQDLLALLLTLPHGDEDATRVFHVLRDVYEHEFHLERMLGAMVELAKSGDAAFLAAHPPGPAEGAASAAAAPPSAPCLEALPTRQLVARALLLFIRDLPRPALEMFLGCVVGRGYGGGSPERGSEEDRKRKGEDGQMETPGFALIRDVVVPLAVQRAPQYWVAHAVLAALDECVSVREDGVGTAVARALRQQCGRQLVVAAVRMANTQGARHEGVPLIRALYGKEEMGVRVALDDEVIKPLEAQGGVAQGIRMVREELSLPVGDSGGKKARPRLPSEDEWDDMVADFLVEEESEGGGDGDGEGGGGGGGGGSDGEGSEGGHMQLLAPSVAFQAAQEDEEDGAMQVVEEIFEEEEFGSDESGDEEEEEEEFDDDLGSEGSAGGDDEEAGSLSGSSDEESDIYDDIFSGDDDSDGEYQLGEDGEEEEFDEAPNDGSYPEGMFFRGPGGDEEDVEEGGGRGCVDYEPTEMELWS